MSDAVTLQRLTAKKKDLSQKAKVVGYTLSIEICGFDRMFVIGLKKDHPDDRYWYESLDEVQAFLQGVYHAKGKIW